jgi:hypothetical protein
VSRRRDTCTRAGHPRVVAQRLVVEQGRVAGRAVALRKRSLTEQQPVTEPPAGRDGDPCHPPTDVDPRVIPHPLTQAAARGSPSLWRNRARARVRRAARMLVPSCAHRSNTPPTLNGQAGSNDVEPDGFLSTDTSCLVAGCRRRGFPLTGPDADVPCQTRRLVARKPGSRSIPSSRSTRKGRRTSHRDVPAPAGLTPAA